MSFIELGKKLETISAINLTFFYHAGAKGFTSGLINIAPQKAFEMLRALQNGDDQTVWKLWNEILPFEELRAKYNNGNNVVVIKEALRQVGLPAGVTRMPVSELNDNDKFEVKKVLDSWGLLNIKKI